MRTQHKDKKKSKEERGEFIKMWVTVSGTTCQEVKMFLYLLKRRGYIPWKVISLLAELGQVRHRSKPQPQKFTSTFHPSVELPGCLSVWLESFLGAVPRNCPIWEEGMCVQPWLHRDLESRTCSVPSGKHAVTLLGPMQNVMAYALF